MFKGKIISIPNFNNIEIIPSKWFASQDVEKKIPIIEYELGLFCWTGHHKI